MYCVSVFDGEQFAGEWFDSLKDAKGYMDACFEDGTWKDIQLQQWTEEDLLEFMEKGMRHRRIVFGWLAIASGATDAVRHLFEPDHQLASKVAAGGFDLLYCSRLLLRASRLLSISRAWPTATASMH